VKCKGRGQALTTEPAVKDESTIDFLHLPFSEFFLRFFATGTYLACFLKCFMLRFVAWAPGLLATYFSGSYSYYVSDTVHLAWDIVVGMALFVAIYICRQVSPKLKEADILVKHSQDQGFKKFTKDWNNSNAYWYARAPVEHKKLKPRN